MQDPYATKIRSLTYVTLRSIAHILMTAGVGAREFVELAKAAFVDEATERYGNAGKPASMTRVAQRTGLSRPDVRRLRDKYTHHADKSSAFEPTPESQLLWNWYTDGDYMDSRGMPRPLPFKGGKPSLLSLAEGAGTSSAPAKLVQRMIDDGHIAKTANGNYEPMRRNFVNPRSVRGIAVILDMSIVRLAKTVSHNLEVDLDSGWIQRTAYSDKFEESELQLVRRAVRVRAGNFCEEIDDLFAAARNPGQETGRDDNHGTVAGIGVYYFED